MTDNHILPRPTCEFDFSLPDDIDDDDNEPADEGVWETSSAPLKDSAHMKGTIQSETSSHGLESGHEHDTQQHLVDTILSPGLSDDEDGVETFNHLSLAQRIGHISPTKKSPRRSELDLGQNDEIPKAKKPRQSLFGGPVTRTNMEKDSSDFNPPETLRQVIQNCMPGLALGEQAIETHKNRPVGLGFDVGFSEDEVVSHVQSRELSRGRSEESTTIPAYERPAYDLRRNINRTKAISYIDTDETGNYDPTQEARLRSLRMQKAKAAKAANKKAKRKRKGRGKEKAPKPHIPKLIVKLRFKDSIGNVRNITNDEDNWPEGWSEPDFDCVDSIKESQLIYRCNTPGHDAQIAIEDPKGEVDDLTGYPSARGCQQCRRLQKGCSVVDGGAYPCDQCDIQCEEQEGKIDMCEPILMPTLKGSCRQCFFEEKECSFETYPNQIRCENCIGNERNCKLLLPDGYKFPRSSINDIMYGPNRKHLQCTVCRFEKRKCSLKSKSDNPPCKYCKKSGFGCTFYDLETQKTGQKSTAKKRQLVQEVSIPSSDLFSPEDLEDLVRVDGEVMSREVTPDIIMEDEAGKKGVVTQIVTSFSHPIQFNATITQYFDCNFCEMPWFSFVGHFERTVHVMKWDDGLGYTELGGGHGEDKGPTNMCDNCTFSRLQILLCPGHNFERASCDTNQDFDAATEDLFAAAPGSHNAQHQLQRWCSMCFSIATFCCTTDQPSLAVIDADIHGCGARFCNKCIQALQNQHLGDFEGLVAEMDLQPKTSENEQNDTLEGKTRADVGFLSSEGLFMRCMNQSMVEDENDDQGHPHVI